MRPGGHLPDPHNNWVVENLCVRTYSRSRNFLARYQFLNTLEYLNRRWPEIHELCTPDHFIELYRQHLSFSSERSQTLSERPSDDSSNEEDNVPKPRHPRHISKAELRTHFVAHSEWLLAEQMEKLASVRVINIVKWFSWFSKMRIQRREAWSHQVRWGWEPNLTDEEINAHLEMENQEGFQIDVSRFGLDPSKESFTKRLSRLQATARQNRTKNRLVEERARESTSVIPSSNQLTM